jgi:hypothetical protein
MILFGSLLCTFALAASSAQSERSLELRFVSASGAELSWSGEVVLVMGVPLHRDPPEHLELSTESLASRWLEDVGGSSVRFTTAIDGRACFAWFGRAPHARVLTRRNAVSDWSGVWLALGDAAPTEVRVTPAAGLRSIRIRPSADVGAQLVSFTARRLIGSAPLTSYRGATPTPLAHGAVARWSEEGEVRLDEAGELRVDLVEDSASQFALIELRAQRSDASSVEAVVDARGAAAFREEPFEAVFRAPRVAVAGFVLDEMRRPVVGASVWIAKSDLVLAQLESDAAGAFTYRSALAGPFQLVAMAPDRIPSRSDGLAAGASALEIVLPRSSGVRGRLVSDSSASLAESNLVLLRVDSDAPPGSSPGIVVSCDRRGEFELNGLSPGSYVLYVRRVRYREPPVELARREGMEVLPGQIVDLGELRVE